VQAAIFHPSALAAIRNFPESARQAMGQALLDLQYGARIGMPLSRPMPTIAPGVHELRIKDDAGIYRAFYLLRFHGGVIIFHAFAKKTQKTPLREINTARKRLSEMLP
jgi:phage-related protein